MVEPLLGIRLGQPWLSGGPVSYSGTTRPQRATRLRQVSLLRTQCGSQIGIRREVAATSRAGMDSKFFDVVTHSDEQQKSLFAVVLIQCIKM